MERDTYPRKWGLGPKVNKFIVSTFPSALTLTTPKESIALSSLLSLPSLMSMFLGLKMRFNSNSNVDHCRRA
jgi:hypothetical protein